jgi:Flp pilus assembly protein TadG
MVQAIRSRLPSAFARLGGDARGVSAVEFAMLAPLMITLYLGCVETSLGVAAQRKVSLTSATLANLAAQVTSISKSEMDDMLAASSAIISPYSSANLGMTLSCLNIDSDKNVTVKWSVASGSGTVLTSATVPNALLVADTQLIYAQASYAYTPAVGYTITGTLNLSDQMYMSPRISAPAYDDGTTNNSCT